MNQSDNVTVARVYVTEGKHVYEEVFKRLHDEYKVNGVTIFRGVSGFGRSGKMHSSELLDVSFDLPVVIEFFDEDEKIKKVIRSLKTDMPACLILTFSAELN